MKLSIFIVAACIVVGSKAGAQWFDDQSLKSTVLLETWEDSSFRPLGTGIIIYNYSTGRPIIATCAHLLRRSEIYVTINAESSFVALAAKNDLKTVRFDKLTWTLDGSKFRAKVQLRTSPQRSVALNPALDLGVFLIDLPTWTSSASDTTRVSHAIGIPRSSIRFKKDISLGDELYFVGFPFGIGTEGRLQPLVRSGSVAWTSFSSSEFYLDAFSFGGNSGSPVFSKADPVRELDDHNWGRPNLVGIIIGHLGDSVEGLLIQPNPKKAAIIRESRELQNYGLARAIWVDALLPLLEMAPQLTIYE